MKRRLLLTVALAAVAVTGWSLWVSACDKSKDASATNVKFVSAESAGGNCSSKASATTASMNTASAEGCAHAKASATTASADHCAGKTSATTASADHCAGKASATTASASMAGGACCAKGAKGATAAAMNCSQGLAFAGVLAMPAGGPSCAQGAKKAGSTAHAHGMDCDACADMAACSDELKAHGTQTQVVPLKNGVMFVYTAASANSVRAVQAAMVRRTEKLSAITASGDKANLCPECRTIRGSMASGKMNRETVNIEGGCLTLFTSTDPAMVAKLRAMASSQAPSNRMKS